MVDALVYVVALAVLLLPVCVVLLCVAAVCVDLRMARDARGGGKGGSGRGCDRDCLAPSEKLPIPKDHCLETRHSHD